MASKDNIIIRLGDATVPIGSGMRYICHCVNDENKWGAGFVKSIDMLSPKPRQSYLSHRWRLGDIQLVEVFPTVTVCNICAQKGIGSQTIAGQKLPAARLFALYEGLLKIREIASRSPSSIHMPMICCGLAGSHISSVMPVIHDAFIDSGLEVNIYAFNDNDYKDLLHAYEQTHERALHG